MCMPSSATPSAWCRRSPGHLRTVPASASFDADRVVTLAASVGVAVQSLARFCAEEPALFPVILGFGGIGARRRS